MNVNMQRCYGKEVYKLFDINKNYKQESEGFGDLNKRRDTSSLSKWRTREPVRLNEHLIIV